MQSSNALTPIDLTELLGMITLIKLEQPMNAPLEIWSTVSGIGRNLMSEAGGKIRSFFPLLVNKAPMITLKLDEAHSIFDSDLHDPSIPNPRLFSFK